MFLQCQTWRSGCAQQCCNMLGWNVAGVWPGKTHFYCIIRKNRWSVVDLSFNQYLQSTFRSKARFKRRILHAPNRIAELSACKMRRLNQLNATYFNSMRVSRIFDWSSRIYDWSSTVGLNAVFYIRWTVITTFRCLLFVSLVVPEAISVWMALILTFLPFYGLPRRLRGRLEGA